MKLFLICSFILAISSCTEPAQNKMQVKMYFDLKGYFEKEANRLDKSNLKVLKSVSINGSVEQKLVKIKAFKEELNSFIGADINKASWKGEFKVKRNKNLLTYITNNDKIPVKRLEIQYQNNSIKSIAVVTKVENILYASADTLIYTPNIFYEIKKNQKIKLLKAKRYVVQGEFRND